MIVVAVGIGVLCLGYGYLWLFGAGEGGGYLLLMTLALTAAGIWLGALCYLAWVLTRRPSPRELALRADRLLGLPDHLLAWTEWPEGEKQWREVTLRELATRLEGIDWHSAWPLRISRGTRWMSGAAVVLTLIFLGLGGREWQREGDRIAQLEALADERLELAAEVLEDWDGFTKLTDDPELKAFFSEALRLREALADRDPMQPLLEIGQMEEKLKAMAAQVEASSIAPQAAAMAEALEAFEGMGALGAALRQGDFEAAAEEADKHADRLAKSPEASSAIRRNAVVSEMLASAAKRAGQRGNQALSQSLSELSSQAAKGNSASNRSLQSPMRSLGRQLTLEAMRQNRGRTAAMGRDQLNTLRRRLQGESRECTPCLSLCRASGRPGLRAGKTPGGEPFGEETAQQRVGAEEQTPAVIGDGESEVTSLSDTTGSGTAAAPAKPVAFSDYHELSQRAVNDESLPLAHRRVIRTYFERIRPVASPAIP